VIIPPSPYAPGTLDLTQAITGTAMSDFHSDRYLRSTSRRLEHLAGLGLDLDERSVLELGAGIGDLTTFFLDRNCRVHTTEGRPENFEILRQRYASYELITAEMLNLDPPPPVAGARFDVVFCYGLLYHLSDPEAALDYFAARTGGLLLLESIVRSHGEICVNPTQENVQLAGAALTGNGTRPHRAWIWRELQARFPHVYLPTTQPRHIEFPLDWTLREHPASTRSVFIASQHPLRNPLLVADLLDYQIPH